jgi:molecular chaperone HscB
LTHFERLGLPARFGLELAEVERAYLAQSRELHPDYHREGSAAQQRASLELSAALNEAYATLKQPFRRADYLLGLVGGPSAAEHKEMSPAFLEEMLELRMEIEDLRAEADPDSPGCRRMAQQLIERSAKLVQDLTSRFDELEAQPPGGPSRTATLRRIRETLNAARYVSGLLRDLQAD